MNVKNFISFECAVNALAQLSKRLDVDLSVHVAIDLAGRIVRASSDVNRGDIGVVIRGEREFFSVCTRENENVYIAKEMSVVYPWRESFLEDQVIAALAKVAGIGTPKGVYGEGVGLTRIEAEHGHLIFDYNTLNVVEIKIAY
jgi:hypothetical protein